MMTSLPIIPAIRQYQHWAFIFVGALVLVLLSSITSIEGSADTPRDAGQAISLQHVQSITQTFTTTQPNLIGLRIGLRAGEASNAGLTIPLRLRYAHGPPIDLVQVDLVIRSREDGELTISFPQTIASRNPHVFTETLQLVLDIPDTPASAGTVIATRKNPLAHGGLSIDEVSQPKLDLAITPLYQHRWIDSLWPISAMAIGKPGLLGWPPIYVFLAYSYLILLGQGLTALYQAHITTNDDAS
ncbi:MAG: hypothetical protein HGA19_07340 [Oscillochloris sp.]|nr:hypothetical protein [Oscillochloris sp.]